MNGSPIDVLVVGAGPYGLSVGAYAGHHGLRARVVGRPMRFWDEHMPRGMLMRSEPSASGLGSPVTGRSFLDFCAEYGDGWAPVDRPVPVEWFVAYGRWFARQAVAEVSDAEVLRVDRSPTGYRALLSTGETVSARAVVVAVGARPYAHSPAVLTGLPSELATHSSDHRDLNGFAGMDVAVVGAGQSALETAALLAEAGARPTVIARAADLAWDPYPSPERTAVDRLRGPWSALGTGRPAWVWSERPQWFRPLPARIRRRIVRSAPGPAGAWWLRDRLACVPVLTGFEITRAGRRNGRIRLTLQDGSGWHRTFVTDHVIAATGYVPDLGRLTVLSTGVRRSLAVRHRSPVLSRHFESSLPGLYFTGLTAAASFGPAMRFVHGADFAARRITGHLTRTASRGPVARRVPERRVPG